MPVTNQVEVAPPLTNVDDLWFEQAKVHEAAVGRTPRAINRAGELQPLGHAARSTEPARALDAAGGTETVQVKMGKMRGRIESYEQWLFNSPFRMQLVGPFHDRQRRPSPTTDD